MLRAAAICAVCCLTPVQVPAGPAAPADAKRRSQMTVSVALVSACGASTAGVAASADPVELRRATRVSCDVTVPYRIQVLEEAIAAGEPATAARIVSVEF